MVEIKRLENHKLITLPLQCKIFFSNILENEISVILFNVQSLHAHKLDIEDDEVIKESYILALTETHIDKMDSNYLKGYKNISNYMRNNIKFGGVAF